MARRLKPGLGRAAMVVLLSLAGCGGGGSGGITAPPTCPPWQGSTGRVDTRGVAVASLGVEKAWVRSMMTANYLWPQDIPARDPSAAAYSDAAQPYTSLTAWFEDLLSPVTGRDRFSYVTTVQATEAFYAGDQTIGSGIHWHFDASTDTLQVEQVEPDAAAGRSGVVARGDILLAVDGVTLAEARRDPTRKAVNRYVGGVEPDTVCRARLRLLKASSGVIQEVSIDSTAHVPNPVPKVRLLPQFTNGWVGYLQFNQHILSAEAPLFDALTRFRAAQVKDVVLDLRYNGGGLLYIANGLASGMSDAAHTANRMFSRLAFGPNHPPVAETDRNTPFVTRACRPDPQTFECTVDMPLPTLGLPRVYVLVGPRTCSASEALVNGLRGIGVQVVLMGETTCGKPHGFMGHQASGIAYFPIEFEITNDLGRGGYADGLTPDCVIADDRWHELGNPNEALLAAALVHRRTGACPASGSTLAQRASAARPSSSERDAGLQPMPTRDRSPLMDNANGRTVRR
ncbi:S41 family peptidase [Leptothrix discophora]|uniref:S41 family peptidase n=1 Tax=Leptothrix discophora TaxID=89 RepID=A0ABT9G5H8_LEPDI|nr:S41 family peptidase [Leptothrix discophora]MDP4301458.1 S41 family peptidase [Leptothrix discophora]